MRYEEMSKITESLCKKAATLARQRSKDFKKAVKQKAKTERRLEIWPRIKATLIITLAVIGFAGGTLVAIEEVLRRHGPTVTMWGTLCATAIYVASGILLSLAFGFFGKLWADQIKADLKEKQINLGDEISSLQTEIASLKQEAENFCEMAIGDRYRAALNS